MDPDETTASPRHPRQRPGAEPDPPRPLPEGLVVVGEVLCRLHSWTEAQWEAIPAAQRPSPSAYREGLGWVAPLPARGGH